MSIIADVMRTLAGRSGLRDAQLNHNIVDTELARRRGLRPDASPASNRAVARAQHAIQRASARVPELEEDINALPVDRPTAPQLLGGLLALALFFVVETYGALLVMHAREVPSGELLPAAMALSMFMVFATSQMRTEPTGDDQPTAARRVRSALRWLMWIAMYIVVLVAVVVLRVTAGADEEAPMLSIIADGVIVAAAVVAPSLILEHMAARLVRAWVVWRRERQLVVEKRSLERERDRGEAVLTDVAAAQRRWDEEGERMRAEYTAAFVREQARRQRLESTKKASPPIPDGANEND